MTMPDAEQPLTPRQQRDIEHAAKQERWLAITARREEQWLPLEGHERIIQELAHLANLPAQHRTMGPYLSVPPNSGKSRVVQRAIEQIAAETPPSPDGDVERAVVIELSGVANSAQVVDQLLAACRSLKTTGNKAERMRNFVTFARNLGVKIIFMDEFQDLLRTSGRAEELLQTVKTLLLKGFIVVPVGTELVEEALRRDRHLATRFTMPLSFPPLTLPEVRETMAALAQGVAGETRFIFPLPDQKTIQATLELSRGLVGDVLNLTQHALIDHASLSVESIEKAAGKLKLTRVPRQQPDTAVQE